MAAFLGISIKWAKDALPHFQEIGEIIGTLVSGTFLILIGILNLMILISLITLFLKFRKDKINDEKLNDLLDTRGFVSRMVGSYFKFISHSWHVLPLGFLFGLGFDTASEISLLALSSGASESNFIRRYNIFTYIVRCRYEFARYIGRYTDDFCL